jgi:hypothetical protein
MPRTVARGPPGDGERERVRAVVVERALVGHAVHRRVHLGDGALEDHRGIGRAVALAAAAGEVEAGGRGQRDRAVVHVERHAHVARARVRIGGGDRVPVSGAERERRVLVHLLRAGDGVGRPVVDRVDREGDCVGVGQGATRAGVALVVVNDVDALTGPAEGQHPFN